MRRLVILVVAVLVAPTTTLGQNYTFGDWARDQGYEPGDVMPQIVAAGGSSPAIDSLNGISEFDWTTAPTVFFFLWRNQLSSIASGAFSGLTNLPHLDLSRNQISSIEAGAFSGLTNLDRLFLNDNQLSSIASGAFSGLANLEYLNLSGNSTLTELNLAGAEFLNLGRFTVYGNQNIASVSLEDAVVSQSSLAALLDGGDGSQTGIGELTAVNELDLSGVDFVNITDLSPLFVMDDLTDLWLANTENLNAVDLDELLDNLETIEETDVEGILYMTQANFDAFDAAGGGLLAAWDAEPGHHVAFGPERVIGDLNLDGEVNGLDVDPFVDVLLNGPFWPEADMNEDGRVNGLDVDPFVVAVGDGGAQQIPEPTTLLLALVALGVVGGWRKWGG